MGKPQPKHEIVIQQAGVRTGNPVGILLIYPATADMVNWIQSEAPAFGMLHKPQFDGDICWTFHVYPIYDAAEVQAYLETGGSSESEDTTP